MEVLPTTVQGTEPKRSSPRGLSNLWKAGNNFKSDSSHLNSPRGLRLPMLYGLLTCACLVFISTFIFVATNKSYFYSEGSKVQHSFPMANSRSSVPGVGYVFLALGAQANQMNCPAAIESLVKYGGWNGNIYLITDREDCFDEEEIVSNADMEKSKFHLLKTSESYSDGGIDLLNHHMGTRKNRIRSFSVKAQIFDYVQDLDIHTLAFADCDVLFGAPGCASEYVNAALPFNNSEAIKFSRVYRDVETGLVTNIHSGSFVAQRSKSTFILKQWRTELERFTYEHDRDGLLGAYHEGKRQNRPLHEYNPGEMPHYFERFFDSKNAESPACINHISKARCADEGRDTVQSFVDRFKLKSYYSKYKYCPHPSLQPLLYGWFPFSMVPFCPKIEAIL